MSLIGIEELTDLWQWSIEHHSDRMRRSRISDLMVQGKWHVIWPDLTGEDFDPLVENLYIEALEDKAASAAAIHPFIEVAPTRGTRDDRAERNSQLRRRVFISLMRDSMLEDKQQAFYFDWFQLGMCAVVPWVNWNAPTRHPFLVRLDPRTVFPVAYDSNDQVSQILCVKHRRTADLKHDPVAAEYALPFLRAQLETKGRKMPVAVQEIWYMDDRQWGLAYGVSQETDTSLFRYVSPVGHLSNPTAVWAIEPHEHRLDACPAVVKVRRTADGEIRGPLDPMIPNLRVAQNIMARILDDLEKNTYAPDMIEGVVNPEEFGPGGLLVGTGEGNMKYQSARRPPNTEALQQVALQTQFARGAGAFPQQRSGEPGASIMSAKAVTASMGSYSVQQGWSQRDIALFYRLALSRLANFDEQWCGGQQKEITGWDEGEIYTDKYDPKTFWKGDYRLEVGFHNVGLDEHNFLVRLGVAKNMGGLARRTFMRKSGLVDNPLAEEREIALEGVSDAFQALMFQQASAGNPEPLMRFARAIDGDQTTARQAAMSVIKDLFTVPEQGAASSGGQGNPGAAIQQLNSLEAGGIPGQAEGLPSLPPELIGMLPSGPRTAMAEGV